MASYIESSLSRDESVKEIFTLHWFAWMPVITWAILGLPTLGLTLIIAIYQGLSLKYLEQGLTNKRVILKKGICSGSMIPDTHQGGNIAILNEVSDDQKTTFFFA
jgi:hypothetical protein